MPYELGQDESERWVSVGEAAAVASRDKTTIRRWADDQLVVARRSATGHRQVLLSSLRAVLSSGPATVPERCDPTAGRVMFERWVREAAVLARWAPDRRTPVETLEAWRAQLLEVADTVAYLDAEIASAVDEAEGEW